MNPLACGPLPADVQRRLATARLGRRLYFYPVIGSTNDAALELARSGEPEGTVVMTDHQSTGRGRRGHTWSSPPGRDVLMSLVLRPGSDARAALPVTLVAALSISVVLSKLLDVEVGVKWPNDVMCERGKLAGILAESSTASTGLTHLVLGCGINVNVRAAEFPDSLALPAASCHTLTGHDWNRADIAADVLGTIEAYYDRLVRDGFGPLRAAYENRLMHMEREVMFEQRGARASGLVRGVAEDGALRIDINGEETLLYGESIEAVA